MTTTLVDLREHLESLASDDGKYYLVCSQYGDRPVPAASCRFERRATARYAARVTEQYRRLLRQYDPAVPRYDIVVTQAPGRAAGPTQPNSATQPSERGGLVEFCHRTAAAVFEALSVAEHDAVEAAVMDAYFELAEARATPDDLCRCLLETMATELSDRLSPGTQAAVLADAGARLEAPPSADDAVAVEETFGHLREHDLVGDYARSPLATDSNRGDDSTVVRLSEYALSPRDGRLPTLPVAVTLAHHRHKCLPVGVRADAGEDEWLLELSASRPADGVASVPIQPGVN